MSIVTRQAPLEAQQFIEQLQECFPDLNKLQPFTKKPEFYSRAFLHEFTIYSSGYWNVGGEVRDIQGGCEYSLEPSFAWSTVAVNTVMLCLVTFAVAFGVVVSHVVPPDQYAALSTAQKASVDFWWSPSMFFTLSLTLPILYIGYCWTLSRKPVNLVETILQKLSAKMPEGLNAGSNAVLPTYTDQGLCLTCKGSSAEFLQCLAQELRATDATASYGTHQLLTPSPDGFVVSHRTGKAVIEYSAQYVTEGDFLKIYIKPHKIPDSKATLITWLVLCGLIGSSKPAMAFSMLVLGLLAAVLIKLGNPAWLHELAFSDIIKRAIRRLPAAEAAVTVQDDLEVAQWLE